MPCLDVYRFCGPVEGSGEPSLLRCSDGSYTNDVSACTLAPAAGCDASQGQYPDKDSCCAAFREAYRDHPGYLRFGVCGASTEPSTPPSSPPSAPPSKVDVPPPHHTTSPHNTTLPPRRHTTPPRAATPACASRA